MSAARPAPQDEVHEALRWAQHEGVIIDWDVRGFRFPDLQPSAKLRRHIDLAGGELRNALANRKTTRAYDELVAAFWELHERPDDLCAPVPKLRSLPATPRPTAEARQKAMLGTVEPAQDERRGAPFELGGRWRTTYGLNSFDINLYYTCWLETRAWGTWSKPLSTKYLARKTGLSKATVCRTLKRLEDNGLLHRERVTDPVDQAHLATRIACLRPPAAEPDPAADGAHPP
jgi:DNA-binding transcriptional ArsR family regulator